MRRRWAAVAATAAVASAAGGSAAVLLGGSTAAFGDVTTPDCTVPGCPDYTAPPPPPTSAPPPVTSTPHHVDRAPGAVTHLTMTRNPRTGRVTLAWVNPGARDLSSVIVWRSQPPHCPATAGSTARVGGATVRRSQVDKYAKPGTTYCYAVYAVDRAGHYSRAANVTAPRDARAPAAPTATATPVATGGVRVSWTWPSAKPADLAGVVVRRGADGRCPAKHTDGTAVPASGGGAALDRKAVAGSSTCYSVFAFDRAGNYSHRARLAPVSVPSSQPSTQQPPPQSPAPGPSQATATKSGGALGSTLARLVALVGGGAVLLASLVFLALRGYGGWRSPRSAYAAGSRMSLPRVELGDLDVSALVVPLIVGGMVVVAVAVFVFSL